MNSLMLLWMKIAQESAIRCHTSATMDIKNVQGRFKHEGLSFFTITLPSFGKDFQKSLDQGIVAHDMFGGFSRHGGLPRFLGGFLELVFDRNSGVLLDDPNIDAILAIRQLTLIYSKIQLPCSDAREKDAMDGYIQCEKEVRENDAILNSGDYQWFRETSFLLFSRLFTKLDKLVYDGNLVPKHGPGATADKLRGNSKYRQRVWTDRLEKYFHSGDFLFPSPRYFAEEYDDLHFLEPGNELPVRVISVPKTLKTPRIIAIEPTCMQYAQQAMLEAFVQGVEEDNILSNLIGFVSQKPNQLLAQKGSSDGSLATLDLSEASDRVSNQLVREMLRPWPHLHGAVEACRSRKADVPGHGVIRLAKFASMGSALCFPIEAMVFLTLSFMGIEREHNTRLTPQMVKSHLGEVRIYGDDIIVPVDTVSSVIHTLEHFGARVGASKSFWIGRFRESCGKEYYDGTDISIVKCRRVFPSSRKHVQETISLVSLRNQLYKAGYWSTTRWLDSKLEEILKYYPWVHESSPVLGRHSFLGVYDADRICRNLQKPLVKGYVVDSRLPRDYLEGSGALLKYFLKRGDLPFADAKHLERAGRPRTVDIKTRWCSPV